MRRFSNNFFFLFFSRFSIFFFFFISFHLFFLSHRNNFGFYHSGCSIITFKLSSIVPRRLREVCSALAKFKQQQLRIAIPIIDTNFILARKILCVLFFQKIQKWWRAHSTSDDSAANKRFKLVLDNLLCLTTDRAHTHSLSDCFVVADRQPTNQSTLDVSCI